ncbi:MAG: hypothetical protein HRU30_02045 [Rhodobacteraceae bacterium]|nr:hypothetical protein [Paracoccaceae bacterium]
MMAWTSLAEHISVAQTFYGDTAQRRVADWIAREEDLVGNTAFAKHFASHFETYDAREADYAHRKIHSSQGALLGGIRFFGGDTHRPFVDVIAHDFGESAMAYAALAACVAEEWRVFSPRSMRVLVSAARFEKMRSQTPATRLDQSVFAARCDQMAPPDQRVTLAPFGTASEAVAMVEARYRDLAQTQPALAQDVAPSDPEDIQDMWQANQLHAITVQGTTVGALAVAPSGCAWIDGAEIMEEVVSCGYAGHGYAASAQKAWAAHHGTAESLLFGTIDGANLASQRTAERAGRAMVLAYAFIDLPPV